MTISMFVIAYLIGFTIAEIGKAIICNFIAFYKAKKILKKLEDLSKSLQFIDYKGYELNSSDNPLIKH